MYVTNKERNCSEFIQNEKENISESFKKNGCNTAS